MRLTLEYPVMARGVPKGAKKERIGVWSEKLELDVREVAGYEAPVAMVVTSILPGNSEPKSPSVTRKTLIACDGKLYTLMGAAEDGKRVLKAITDRLVSLVVTTVNADLRGDIHSSAYWPISGHDIAGRKFTQLFNGLEAGDFTIAEHDIERAELHRERARRVADGLLVVDGELWEECDEPVYTVATRASPGIEVLGGHPVTATVSQHFRIGYMEPYVRVFNANEYDMACASKDLAERYRKPHAIEPRGFIEVLMPEVVSYPAAERELDRLARHLVRNFSRVVKNGIPRSGGNCLEDIPTTVLSAWAQVRDIVGGYNPLRSSVPEALEQAVEHLLEQYDRFPGEFRDSVTDEDIRELMARWRDREIDFTPEIVQVPTP